MKVSHSQMDANLERGVSCDFPERKHTVNYFHKFTDFTFLYSVQLFQNIRRITAVICLSILSNFWFLFSVRCRILNRSVLGRSINDLFLQDINPFLYTTKEGVPLIRFLVDSGENALRLAKAVERLLSKDINPLLYATNKGVLLIRFLIDSGENAIFLAVRLARAVEILLSARINPFLYATNEGVPLISFLIDSGENAIFLARAVERLFLKGIHPLLYATNEGVPLIRFLIDSGKKALRVALLIEILFDIEIDPRLDISVEKVDGSDFFSNKQTNESCSSLEINEAPSLRKREELFLKIKPYLKDLCYFLAIFSDHRFKFNAFEVSLILQFVLIKIKNSPFESKKEFMNNELNFIFDKEETESILQAFLKMKSDNISFEVNEIKALSNRCTLFSYLDLDPELIQKCKPSQISKIFAFNERSTEVEDKKAIESQEKIKSSKKRGLSEDIF